MRDPMLIRDPAPGAKKEAKPDRSKLMEQHAQARARREAAELGSDEYRAAVEEIGRIEIAIARLEEPAAQ